MLHLKRNDKWSEANEDSVVIWWEKGLIENCEGATF